MDAVITAGGIPGPEDPLYEYTQGKSKALLDIAGKPMVQWVLDAVCGSENIDQIVIIGLESDSALNCTKPITYIPNQGSMLDNVRGGILKIAEINPRADHAIMVSSDIPALTTEMVDWAVKTTDDPEVDLYYNLITKEVMEARYPGSNRSFVKLKDVVVCGGDMNVLRVAAATGNDELWQKLISARKNPFKQAALFGYGTLIQLLTRRLTLEDAVPRIEKQLGIKGRPVLCPYAELGMDVDKPYQYEILRKDLEAKKATS
jgi:GTP:adenosylcobinamide-phosphate guanylyltransferase